MACRNYTSQNVRAGLSAWVKISLLCLIMPVSSTAARDCTGSACAPAVAPTAADGSNPTTAWGGKFRYGAYSTLIASYLLAREFPHLMADLGRYDGSTTSDASLQRRVAQYINRYNSLPTFTVQAIIAFARNNRSNSVYEEERSAIQNDTAGAETFRSRMANGLYQNLIPKGDAIHDGSFVDRNNWQFNIHRTLYNRGFGIQENTLAGLLAGYAAGLRSFEFDILDSGGYPPESVVFHDVVTNRMTGAFTQPKVNVEMTAYSALRNTNIDIVNILAPLPTVESTPQRVMPKTSEFVRFATNVLPRAAGVGSEGVTLYADARNKSPSTLIRQIYSAGSGSQAMADRIVIKIYSFQYRAGAQDLIADYASKFGVSNAVAGQQIAAARPNVLLPVGSGFDASEETKNSNLTDFNATLFQNISHDLPFTTTSTSRLNQWFGQPIFNSSELYEIENQSVLAAKWLLDFSAVTNVMVWQQSLGPSLKYLVNNQANVDVQRQYNAMTQKQRISAAATDNVLAILEGATNGRFGIAVDGPRGKGPFSQFVKTPIWGLSDRFPDFILTNGRPGQQGLVMRNFYFAMTGQTCEKQGVGDLNKRSLARIYAKIQEIGNSGSTIPVRYITTDLDTDLPATMMGVYPNWANWDDKSFFFQANRVKSRFTPVNIPGYQMPDWSFSVGPTIANAEGGQARSVPQCPADFPDDYN